MKTKGILVLAAAMMAVGSFAESITHGGTTINMDFVNIGFAGNAPDKRIDYAVKGYGDVDYDYRIGKYEVTIGQFAKAHAADSRVGNGNENYWNDGTRTVGASGPASNVSAFEAMQFANFLTTGDAYTGAYQFNGSGVLTAIDRDAAVSTYGTVYVLPSEDEWYKAAYYRPINDGSYSRFVNGDDNYLGAIHGTSSGWNYNRSVYGDYVNDAPNYTWETGFGAEEQNGTFDMIGNVFEFIEDAADQVLDDLAEPRGIRGGSYAHTLSLQQEDGAWAIAEIEISFIGFRVVAIPEPSSIAMIGLVSGSALFIRKRFLI